MSTILTGLDIAMRQGRLPVKERHPDSKIIIEIADAVPPIGALLYDFHDEHIPHYDYALEKLNAAIKRLEWAYKIYEGRKRDAESSSSSR